MPITNTFGHSSPPMAGLAELQTWKVIHSIRGSFTKLDRLERWLSRSRNSRNSQKKIKTNGTIKNIKKKHGDRLRYRKWRDRVITANEKWASGKDRNFSSLVDSHWGFRWRGVPKCSQGHRCRICWGSSCSLSISRRRRRGRYHFFFR